MPHPAAWQLRGLSLRLDRPIVMGIVNVTPDSFSDGGRFLDPSAALAHARRLVAEGADVLDVGGESTRPQGAVEVDEAEELRRILPVIEALASEHPAVALSVDTVKSAVAAVAVRSGAHLVNDVSGLRLDPAMARVVADTGAGLVVMHSRGAVADMATYAHADYVGDPVDAIVGELDVQRRVALDAGIEPARIALDPGIGFAKRPEHSLRALACVGRLASLGHAVVVGASRKRFIGGITGVTDASARVFGSVGAAVAAFERGARIFRVHDVAATRQALDVAAAVRAAETR
jgi:dihydropteroate synthase